MYSGERAREISVRSGGGAPNHFFASGTGIALCISSPILVWSKIRFCSASGSGMPRSIAVRS